MILLITNIVPAYYLSQVHQRGVIDVMFYLEKEMKTTNSYLDNSVENSVFFMMPCHSTPLTPIMHSETVKIKTLACDPPLDTHSTDEAAQFYHDKLDYFRRMDLSNAIWGYIVLFQVLERDLVVKEWLNDNDYTRLVSFFNTHWHWDSKREGDVVVYKKEHAK